MVLGGEDTDSNDDTWYWHNHYYLFVNFFTYECILAMVFNDPSTIAGMMPKYWSWCCPPQYLMKNDGEWWRIGQLWWCCILPRDVPLASSNPRAVFRLVVTCWLPIGQQSVRETSVVLPLKNMVAGHQNLSRQSHNPQAEVNINKLTVDTHKEGENQGSGRLGAKDTTPSPPAP